MNTRTQKKHRLVGSNLQLWLQICTDKFKFLPKESKQKGGCANVTVYFEIIDY